MIINLHDRIAYHKLEYAKFPFYPDHNNTPPPTEMHQLAVSRTDERVNTVFINSVDATRVKIMFSTPEGPAENAHAIDLVSQNILSWNRWRCGIPSKWLETYTKYGEYYVQGF